MLKISPVVLGVTLCNAVFSLFFYLHFDSRQAQLLQQLDFMEMSVGRAERRADKALTEMKQNTILFNTVITNLSYSIRRLNEDVNFSLAPAQLHDVLQNVCFKTPIPSKDPEVILGQIRHTKKNKKKRT